MFRQLRLWTIHLARSPHSRTALFLVAFIESSVFPIPPDVLLIALVLVRPRQWYLDAGVCLAGSVLGGMFGYWLGWQVWLLVDDFFFHYVFSRETFEAVRSLYHRYDFWAVFVAGFTPLPYKIFTIAGGVCTIHFPVFVLASVLSRGARFFLVAGLLRIFGERILKFIEKYFNWLSIVFVILLIGGFLVLKYCIK